MATSDAAAKGFRIRSITAGTPVSSLADTKRLEEALAFLGRAREWFEAAGYEAQTTRVATPPLHRWRDGERLDGTLSGLTRFDARATEAGAMLAVGAPVASGEEIDELVGWAGRVLAETETISFSLPLVGPDGRFDAAGAEGAAEVTTLLAERSEGGEGNFRFCATANCPPGIPFFPAATHEGERSFALALEYPRLLTEALAESDGEAAGRRAKERLEAAFRPLQALAAELGETTGWAYGGIDTSPAPGLDASVAEAIETLSGVPFGEAGTLRACGLVTEVVKGLDLRRCGYCGLMLPVIEDTLLAQRASEGRFSVSELLLYSAVCGTGLDVTPLPGATSVAELRRVYGDLATLSIRSGGKALSARLFPIPGKAEGELATFRNPYLTACRVMGLGRRAD